MFDSFFRSVFSERILNSNDNIIAEKTVFILDNQMNDMEVESKIEYFLYQNGKVMSKCYFGGRLYMVSISSDGVNIFNSAAVSTPKHIKTALPL